MYVERFANNLKTLIGNKSVNQVAKEIGIQQVTLQRYVRGKNEIGIENLVKIANFFNEDLNVLTGRKEY